MFRLTLVRCMHDRKIPNITSSKVFPPVLSSYDSPKKFDQSKPIKKEPSKWKQIWPKFRVHSQQYREYKATRGDGTHIPSWNVQPVSATEAKVWCDNLPKLPPLPKYVKNDYDDGWSSEAAKPYEHAESEEEATVWNDEAWEKEKKKNYTSVHRSSTYSSDCYEGRRNEYLPNNDAEAEQFKKDQAKFASFGEMQEMDGYSQARWGEVKSSDTGLDSVEAEADKKREWLSFKALFKKK